MGLCQGFTHRLSAVQNSETLVPSLESIMHSYRRKDGLAGPTLLYVREWSWALWFVVTVRRVRSGWPPSMGSLREACFVQDRPGPGRWGFTRRSGLGLWVCASTAFAIPAGEHGAVFAGPGGMGRVWVWPARLRVSVKWRPARPLSSPPGAGRRRPDLLEMGLFSASGYLGRPMLIWAGNGLVLGWDDRFRSGVRRVARDSVLPHPPRPPWGENIGRGCCAPGDCARGATALFTVPPRCRVCSPAA